MTNPLKKEEVIWSEDDHRNLSNGTKGSTEGLVSLIERSPLRLLQLVAEFVPRSEEYSTWTGNHATVWVLDNKWHRINGPAYIHRTMKTEEWYLNDRLHRIGGPANIHRRTGEERWLVNGKLHRIDGPAVSNLWRGTGEWWIDGVEI